MNKGAWLEILQVWMNLGINITMRTCMVKAPANSLREAPPHIGLSCALVPVGGGVDPPRWVDDCGALGA